MFCIRQEKFDDKNEQKKIIENLKSMLKKDIDDNEKKTKKINELKAIGASQQQIADVYLGKVSLAEKIKPAKIIKPAEEEEEEEENSEEENSEEEQNLEKYTISFQPCCNRERFTYCRK